MTVKHYHALFFYFLITFLTYGAKADVEISGKFTDNYGADTTEVKLLLRKAVESIEVDIQKTIEYTQKAMLLSENIQFTNGIIQSYSYRGEVEGKLNNYPKSLEYLLYAYKLGKDKKINSYHLAYSTVLIGNIYANFYQNERALKCATEAKLMLSTITPQLPQLDVYLDLAMLYVTLKNYEAADSIRIFIEDTFFKNDHISTDYKLYTFFLSQYYSALGDKVNSLKFGIESTDTVEDMVIPSFGIKYFMYNNLGNIYFTCNNYDSAIFYYNKSLNLNLGINLTKWKAINYRDLGYAYLAKKEYAVAQKYATKYLDLATSNNFFEDTKRAYKLLYEINVQDNNYKSALSHLIKYSQINDSINNVEKSAIVLNVYFKEIINDIESENKSLITDNHKKEDEIKHKQAFEKFLNIIIFTILVFVLIIVIFLLVNRKTTNKLKIQANEIFQKNNQLTFQNQQLVILNEEVQGLVGIVSHDLKAPINRIESLLNFVGLEPENLSANQLNYLRIAVQEVYNSKDLIKNILESEEHTTELKIDTEYLPIFYYLSDFMQNYGIQGRNKDIQILIKIDSSELLLPVNKNYLARILDNLLSNAIKFSNFGTKVYFDAQEFADYILIIIKDEGPGMTPEDLKNIYKKYHKLSAKSTGGESSTGLGLYIVKQLVDKIGGTIDVESKEQEGTTFYIKIPKLNSN